MGSSRTPAVYQSTEFETKYLNVYPPWDTGSGYWVAPAPYQSKETCLKVSYLGQPVLSDNCLGQEDAEEKMLEAYLARILTRVSFNF